MEHFQSFRLGWLIIQNRFTGVQQALQWALFWPTWYPSFSFQFINSILFIFSVISGWRFERLEFPNQWRTEIQENNNYESHFVSTFFQLFFCSSSPSLDFSLLSSSILAVVGALVNVAYLSWRNRVKKRPEVRARLLEKYVAASKESCDDGGLSAWIELGDRHPDFVYTI